MEFLKEIKQYRGVGEAAVGEVDGNNESYCWNRGGDVNTLLYCYKLIPSASARKIKVNKYGN